MRSRGSITGPLVLILLGAVFLIRAIQPDFQIGELLAHYWPFLLIGWGVIAFLEVTIRFSSGASIPVNGISGGAWVLVVLVCVAGAVTYQVKRPDNWWRQIGFRTGIDALGEDHQYSLPPQKRLCGPAPHIVIESFRGDAKITGADENQVSLTGQKSIRALDNPYADIADGQTRVEMTSDGDTITIRCHQDKAASRAAVTTNLELAVPKGSTVETAGTRGDFDISNIAGDVTISSANAGVRLQDIGGRVRIETSRSDVIRCENVKGDLDLRGHGDDVELYKVAGQVTVNGDYRGTVSLRELAKPVRVQNSRTQLAVQRIPGEVRLDRGSFSAQNVVGPVSLTTHSTDVSFDGFTAGLDLTVDRGDVEIRPNREPLGRIAVHATSGNIELALPQAATFELNAATGRGDIQNDFGLKESSQGNGAKLQGAVGLGPDVNLSTSHGSISVRKASSEETRTVKVSDKNDDEDDSDSAAKVN